MEDQRLVQYKKPENLALLEEILQGIGIGKVEASELYNEQISTYIREKQPYYEVISRANAVIIKQLNPELCSELEGRIGEHNSARDDDDRLVVELVSKVRTLQDYW